MKVKGQTFHFLPILAIIGGFPCQVIPNKDGIIFKKSRKHFVAGVLFYSIFLMIPFCALHLVMSFQYDTSLVDILAQLLKCGLSVTDLMALVAMNSALLLMSFRIILTLHGSCESLTDLSQAIHRLSSLISDNERIECYHRCMKYFGGILLLHSPQPFLFALCLECALPQEKIDASESWLIMGLTWFGYLFVFFSIQILTGLIFVWFGIFSLEMLLKNFNQRYFSTDAGNTLSQNNSVLIFKKSGNVPKESFELKDDIAALIHDGNAVAQSLEIANQGFLGRLIFDECAFGVFFGAIGFFLALSPTNLTRNSMLWLKLKPACLIVGISHTVRFFLLVSFGQKIEEHVARLRQNLRKSMVNKYNEYEEETRFSLEMLMERFQETTGVKSWDSFPLNYASALSLTGSILTYFIVLLQFKISDSQQE